MLNISVALNIASISLFIKHIITDVLCESYLREPLCYIAQRHLRRSGMGLLHKQLSDVIIGRDFAVMTSFLTDMSIKVVIS